MSDVPLTAGADVKARGAQARLVPSGGVSAGPIHLPCAMMVVSCLGHKLLVRETDARGRVEVVAPAEAALFFATHPPATLRGRTPAGREQ